jgi:hypothetical protein
MALLGVVSEVESNEKPSNFALAVDFAKDGILAEIAGKLSLQVRKHKIGYKQLCDIFERVREENKLRRPKRERRLPQLLTEDDLKSANDIPVGSSTATGASFHGCLREASETATLDQTRNANGHASATLDVAPPARRHGVVDLAPDRARFDRDCLLWLVLSLATSTDKRGVQGNGIHPSCPNQQRVCRIGCTLIAVATTLHDESQIVLAGKIDGRHNIIGCLGGHRIGAWSGRPAPDPAQGLREPNLIAEVIGILQFLQNLRAVGARWHFQARSERRLHLKEPPLDIPSESVPVCFGRPCWITRPDA